MKKLLCVVKQFDNMLNLYFFGLNTKNKSKIEQFVRHFFKNDYKEDYVINDSFYLNFPFSSDIKQETLKNYSQSVLEKLKELNLLDRSIDVLVDIEKVFRSRISLPKLTGKALIASYNNELNKQFGDIVNNYTILEDRKINTNKGYDFNLLFVENKNYKHIMDIFHISKLKVENVVYLPSILPNISNGVSGKCMGLIIGEKYSYIFVFKRGVLDDLRMVKVGYANINQNVASKFEIDIKDVKNFCHENISKIALRRVIYSTIRKLFDEIYILLLSDQEKHNNEYTPSLEKIYFHSLDGNTREIMSVVPLKLRKIMEMYNRDVSFKNQLFIDLFYNNQKHFEALPIKVKYEEK